MAVHLLAGLLVYMALTVALAAAHIAPRMPVQLVPPTRAHGELSSIPPRSKKIILIALVEQLGYFMGIGKME